MLVFPRLLLLRLSTIGKRDDQRPGAKRQVRNELKRAFARVWRVYGLAGSGVAFIYRVYQLILLLLLDPVGTIDLRGKWLLASESQPL
jgi:hypothetical protein